MTGVYALPQPTHVDNTWAAPGLAAVLAVVLAVVVFALVLPARRGIRTPNDFIVSGRKVGAGQNTFAMVGMGLMYSTVIIIAGHVALSGFDAIMLLTAFTMSTVLAVLIYAGPARNVGGYTLGDLFAVRAQERPARMASAVVTLVVYGMFMIAILASIGLVASRMFSTSSPANTPFVAGMIALVALIAILWVYLGGMTGVTRLLVLKVCLFMALVAGLTIAVMVKYRMNPIHLLNDAEAQAAPNKRGDLLGPGRLFGTGATFDSNQDPWVHLSKIFSVAAGALGMPFFFMRYLVANSGRDARRSAGWAASIAVAFWQCMIVLGLGATAILGGKAIGSKWDTRDITLPKLADHLGGKWMSAALGAVALLSVAAIFAALLLNGVTTATKDINAARGRQLEPAAELKAIRRNVLVIGVVSLVLGTALAPLLTHIFIPASIDVGGTCILPAVVYSLFWRRFNTRGLLWTIYGGLAVIMFMVLFSNGISGDPSNAMFPNVSFKFIDFEPGLVGVPVGFLLGFIGSLTSRERNDAKFAEMRVRALTGAVIPGRKPAGTPAGPDERARENRTLSEAH
ncbi:MAG: cation/acetate symporter [Micromonosporaceae bacterium]